jgi:Na+/H+-dicarboxylate symporter
LTIRVLVGLALGFALGFAASAVPSLAAVPGWIEPLGALFVNAIRMTVIPLVVSSLVIGVAGAPSAGTVGRLGGRAFVWFAALVLTSAVIGVLVMPFAFSTITPDPAGLAALTGGQNAAELIERARSVPGFAQWLVDLVPVNPVKAAADGALLPLIVFTLAFGVALARIEPAIRRAPIMRVLGGVQDASFVLVRWVLLAAPVGAFALAVPLAARLGVSAAGAVIQYIVVVSVVCVAFMAFVLYPLAIVLGRVSLREFARAAAPVQAVAISARSSMASLPVMIEHMDKSLGLSREITGFLLPLSSTTFRAGAGIGITGGACFIAALYGVDLSPTQLATIAVTTTLLSFSIPGIPAGSIIVMVPVLMAAGVPVEAVGILIGIDPIPDMFRTTTNVTGTMTVATILGARDRVAPPAPA